MSSAAVLLGALLARLSLARLLTQCKGNYSFSRTIECCTLLLTAFLAIAVAGINIFNAVVLSTEHYPGATYLVNGNRMRIDCTGHGSPTIVLEAGLGNDGLIWSDVQTALAKSTRACSYDRAGYGWSHELPPPRDADHIVTELHGLLRAAEVNGPIVLMGHSIGGIYIRDYAAKYPASIAGLVFVDSSTPLQNRNPAFRDRAPSPLQQIEQVFQRAALYAGLQRVFVPCSGSVSGFASHRGRLEREELCREKFGGFVGEQDSFDLSGQETIHADRFSVPVLICSRDPASSASGNRSMEAAWSRMQEDLMMLSVHSRRVVAEGSGHYIELDSPGLLAQEVSLCSADSRRIGRKDEWQVYAD